VITFLSHSLAFENAYGVKWGRANETLSGVNSGNWRYI